MAWILSLGAGKEQIPLLKAIHNEGHKVVAVDIDPNAEGVDLCDAFRSISNRDVDAVTEYAKWAGVHGVMCAASEVADVMAISTHRLGLPGISVATALTCKDKLLQKKCLKAAGVLHTEAVPIYRGSAKAVFDSLKYKVVVKPQSGSGSRGVTYVDNPMELDIAIRAAEAVSSDVIMEKYQPGPQISAELVVFDGSYKVVAFVDRFYPAGRPRFQEIGGALPSHWGYFDASGTMMEAAEALGMSRGTMKFDLVLTNSGPMVIEATPRLSGGPLSSIVYDSTGVDYLRQAVRVALGEEPDWKALEPRKEQKVARHMDGTDMDWDDSRQYVVMELGT
jgi:biotin carboxylase